MGDRTDLDSAVNEWLALNSKVLQRWQHMMAEVQAAQNDDFSVFTVATRGLADCAMQCQPASRFR